MAFTVEQILGPLGLLVASLIAVWALWREDRKSRQRDHDLIDKLTAVVELFPKAVTDQTAVIKDWAERIDEERDRAGRRDRRAGDR